MIVFARLSADGYPSLVVPGKQLFTDRQTYKHCQAIVHNDCVTLPFFVVLILSPSLVREFCFLQLYTAKLPAKQSPNFQITISKKTKRIPVSKGFLQLVGA